jgi:hypothetical protein
LQQEHSEWRDFAAAGARVMGSPEETSLRLWHKLRYLVPSIRRAADRDMKEELDALKQLAGPRELGNLTLAAEEARGEMGWRWLEQLGQDLRYGLRSMARDKVFTVLAVASLAWGIGANTSIYSFIESILLRPLPVSDPQSLGDEVARQRIRARRQWNVLVDRWIVARSSGPLDRRSSRVGLLRSARTGCHGRSSALRWTGSRPKAAARGFTP